METFLVFHICRSSLDSDFLGSIPRRDSEQTTERPIRQPRLKRLFLQTSAPVLIPTGSSKIQCLTDKDLFLSSDDTKACAHKAVQKTRLLGYGDFAVPTVCQRHRKSMSADQRSRPVVSVSSEISGGQLKRRGVSEPVPRLTCITVLPAVNTPSV